MRGTRTDDQWRWRFALLPTFVLSDGKTVWIWLEWYQQRWRGDYIETRLTDVGNITPPVKTGEQG